MTVKFYKYQGTGNDFIMIDNRQYGLNKSHTAMVRRLCDRKFGIGADGLILLNEKMSVDFEMVYFNSDGNESSMCGNGGRCLIKFAHQLGIIKADCKFLAIDGEHEGKILPKGLVSLKMKDVEAVENYKGDFILNTGSPHYVKFVKDVKALDVFEEGRNIRNSEKFVKEGINVNFAERKGEKGIFVRTYERGVEDETLSCGTGVVATAIASLENGMSFTGAEFNEVKIETPGGNLLVKFQATETGYNNIYLIGPAEMVFEGEVEC